MHLTRKRIYPLSLIIFALFIIGYLYYSPQPSAPSPHVIPPRSVTGSIMSSPSPLATSGGVLSETETSLLFPVVKVVDGDTITVLINNKKETIRLIGINTPETVDPRKSVQCFGKEASDHAKSLLTQTSVHLEGDPTQSERDKYGRLLRYVYLIDGTNFNRHMIAEGFAYEYTYNSAYEQQSDFKAAQRVAQEVKKGLWSEATCKGAL